MKPKFKTTFFLSFLIPIILTTIYFWYRGMAPFGKSTLLTVDLGQQYIDFFAYYHQTLLHNPTAIFYSFSKALGGDMLGTWSYYLLSPLNLITLLFPISKLPAAITIITILKYGLSGLSFSFMLSKKHLISGLYITMFSTAYALMGWMVAYQFNVIWLDALILLPLIFYGLQILLDNNSRWLYIWSLALMLMINYYCAYMISIFMCIYFIVYNYPQKHEFKIAFIKFKRWALASIISFLLSAWITIPTVFALISSKIQDSNDKVSFFTWEYFPLNFLGKFINGSLNFKQLPSGTPNIFVGSLVIFLFVYYFFSPHVIRSNKRKNLIMTLILLVSMDYQPLDIFWHALQMPVWYPYRFSFIFSFWMIITAIDALVVILQNKLDKRAFMFSGFVVFLGFAYILIAKIFNRLQYINYSNYLFGIGFMAITLMLIFFIDSYGKSRWYKWLLLLFVTSEMGFNLFSSLNNLSYLSNTDYTNFAKMIKQPISQIKKENSVFYRIGTTFIRTKNDAFTGDFNGGSLFSSTLEHKTVDFYSQIGQQASHTTVLYSHGTLFTDSLLNMKYYITNNRVPFKGTKIVNSGGTLRHITNRPDLKYYQLNTKNNLTNVYQNPYAMPLGFIGKNKNVSHIMYHPLDYQNELAKQIAPSDKSLFTQIPITDLTFKNVNIVNNLNGAIVHKTNLLGMSSLGFDFVAQPKTAYYLTIGNNLSSQDLYITVNGKRKAKLPMHEHAIVLNISSVEDNSKAINVQLHFKKDNLLLSNIHLYKLPIYRIASIAKIAQNNSLNITHMNNHRISGKIDVQKNHQALLTSIPYSKGWKAIVDDKVVSPKDWANGMFLKLPLDKGKHKINLIYFPQGLKVGSLITLFTLIFMAVYIAKQKRRN